MNDWIRIGTPLCSLYILSIFGVFTRILLNSFIDWTKGKSVPLHIMYVIYPCICGPSNTGFRLESQISLDSCLHMHSSTNSQFSHFN